MPINYLIIKSLQKFGDFYGDQLTLEYPVGSGEKMPLKEAVNKVIERVVSLFTKDVKGERKIYAEYNSFYAKPENSDLLQFFEYFNGDTGRGLGASHQTGWTALVANLLSETAGKDEVVEVGEGSEEM
jgi:hypothetical protein